MFWYKQLKKNVEMMKSYIINAVEQWKVVSDNITNYNIHRIESHWETMTKLSEMTATETSIKETVRAKGYEQLDKMSIPWDAKQAVKAMLESITK